VELTMQQIIVALVVAIAVVVSIWKLMPARRRLQALLKLDAWTANHSALAGFRERTLKPRIVRAAGSGCAGCAANVGVRPQHPPR
jgi:hypothetical protein